MRTRLRRPTAAHRPRRLLGAATAAVLLVALSACASTDDAAEPGSSTQPPQTLTHATTEPSTPPSASAEPTTGTDDGQDGTGADVPANGTTTLTTPTSGATVTGPTVTFSGTSTAFEGNLRWQVLPAAGGDPVAEGFTTGGANGEIGPFEFTQDLTAGDYRVEVWEPDESDGEGTATEDGRRNLVAVTFTVG